MSTQVSPPDPPDPPLTRWYPLAVFVAGALWVLAKARDRFADDEWRYVWYAENLLRGFYSPTDNEMVWNGPGYPLWLAPFLAAGAPLLVPKLFNAALLALAVLYVHRALRLYCSPARATVGGLVVGLSPLSYQNLAKVHTETMALFLASGLVFHFCASRAGGAGRAPGGALAAAGSRRHAALAGLHFGALALTKISFGPPLLLGAVGSLAWWAFGRRRSATARNALVASAVALAACLPWLHYTYRMSGKLFYWSNAGGQVLYWMTSPHDEDLGEWHHHGEVKNVPVLREHHGRIYDELAGDPAAVAGTDLERKLPGVGRLCSIEADGAFWRLAFRQLRERPANYVRNCFFNAGRLFFDYPYSLHRRHHPWALIALHLFVVGAAVAVAARRLLGRLRLPPEVEVVALFALAETALSIGVSAVGRYFLALYPAYLLVGLVGTAPARWRAASAPAAAAVPRGGDDGAAA